MMAPTEVHTSKIYDTYVDPGHMPSPENGDPPEERSPKSMFLNYGEAAHQKTLMDDRTESFDHH
jgi:hypothetical protein